MEIQFSPSCCTHQIEYSHQQESEAESKLLVHHSRGERRRSRNQKCVVSFPVVILGYSNFDLRIVQCCCVSAADSPGQPETNKYAYFL